MEANNEQIIKKIREISTSLLDEDRVDKVIGYGTGDFSDEITPVFITDSSRTSKLIFNENCGMMLAKYLLDYPDARIGIIAKPCDTRAIATYLNEGLIERDKITIIGINGCLGIEGNSACDECTVRNPVVSDYEVGEPLSAEEIEEERQPDEENKAESLESMTPEERKEYFQKQFERCTRCYACREACYTCYCEECFVDSNQPFWLGESVNADDNFTYHLMRSMHMAGRCINCGACEIACPENIDVRALSAKMYHVAKDIYDFEPGKNPETGTLLTDYDVNDSQSGFIE